MRMKLSTIDWPTACRFSPIAFRRLSLITTTGNGTAAGELAAETVGARGRLLGAADDRCLGAALDDSRREVGAVVEQDVRSAVEHAPPRWPRAARACRRGSRTRSSRPRGARRRCRPASSRSCRWRRSRRRRRRGSRAAPPSSARGGGTCRCGARRTAACRRNALGPERGGACGNGSSRCARGPLQRGRCLRCSSDHCFIFASEFHIGIHNYWSRKRYPLFAQSTVPERAELAKLRSCPAAARSLPP